MSTRPLRYKPNLFTILGMLNLILLTLELTIVNANQLTEGIVKSKFLAFRF